MTEQDAQHRLDRQDQNYVSLKEYVEGKFEATEQAIRLANEALNARLESMNQFREDLRAQAAHFLTRQECCSSMDRVREDIRFLRESRALLEGKASQLSVTIAALIALIGLFLSIAALVHDLL